MAGSILTGVKIFDEIKYVGSPVGARHLLGATPWVVG